MDSIVSSVFRHLTVEGLWDDAFALLSTSAVPALLPDLLEASLDKLLREGRTATLKRWIDAAEEAQIQSPIIDLAEASSPSERASIRRPKSWRWQPLARCHEQVLWQRGRTPLRVGQRTLKAEQRMPSNSIRPR